MISYRLNGMVATLINQVQARATRRLKSHAGRNRRTPSQSRRTTGIWTPMVGVRATASPTETPSAVYSGG